MESTGDQAGGSVLGKGSYGCVFSPPLLCKEDERPISRSTDNKLLDLTNKSIDKIANRSTAEHEFKLAKRIQTLPLWKNYYIIADSICEPAPAYKQIDQSFKDCKIVDPGHLDRYRLLRMRYGGKVLHSYRMDFIKHSFYEFARHLIEGGAILTLFGIIHMDLHGSNVVVDSLNVPRIIDFNLAVDIKQKDLYLSRSYMPELSQISPDNSLVKAPEELRGNTAIRDISKKYNIVVLSSVLGISPKEQERELTQFYKISKAIQTGNIQKWFSHYWRVQDSWAIGFLLTNLISEMSRWPSFANSDYAVHSDKLLPVLRGMCAPSPRKRIDCIQALYRLEPNHYIFRTYPKSKDWLERVKVL
jgi:serine/threonine protein kinase